jgi:curved DNA-binding protein CbpA
MPSQEELIAWVKVAETKTYYEILRVNSKAPADEVKKAFHRFALLCHPDQFSDQPKEVQAAAGEAFKRGVESYRVLSNAKLRERYDRTLARGNKRLDDKSLSDRPPPPKGKTLEQVARTARGKEHARKADRQLTIGKLEAARVLLVTAFQEEPDNEELGERLKLIYEALALEPL